MTDTLDDAKPTKSRTVYVVNEDGKSRDALVAELALGGIMNSASIAAEYSRTNYGELNLMECVGALTEKVIVVRKGSLTDAETLLIAQAHALDSIFSSLARRAA